ncbi:MAG: hypothetical protein U9N77_11640 [Thermodesulfobacteriota bacterium]|nr:hypothetical protein [Thermodesulfobacteriota bacterium]
MNSAIKKNFPIILIVCLFGCASGPDIVSTDKNNTRFSNAETREICIDNPTMISGDYFRERQQTPSLNLGQLLASKKKSSSDQKNLEKKVEQLQQEVASIKNSPDTLKTIKKNLPEHNNVKVKIGLLIDKTSISPANIHYLSSAAVKLESKMPMVLVNNDEIYETLAKSQDIENKDLYRTSGILTVYPGIRMLVLVENFKFPDICPGMASAKISIVDSGLFHRYQSMNIKMPVKNAGDIGKFTENIMYSALGKAVKASKISPWFCRIFSKEKNLFYINAGKKTGLKKGDLLKIISGGKLIKSPAGIPAGWIPGQEKGILKVDLLFGKDFAECSLTKGKEPCTEDLLVNNP